MIQHVREVIPQTLERLGLAERVWCARAALHWPTVAEGVRRGAAKASTARAGSPGTLLVSVRSSAWQTELVAREAEIKAALNERVDGYIVERLQFRVTGHTRRR